MPSIISERFKWHDVLYFDKDDILLQSAKSVLWITDHKLSNAIGDGAVCGCTLRGKYIKEKAKYCQLILYKMKLSFRGCNMHLSMYDFQPAIPLCCRLVQTYREHGLLSGAGGADCWNSGHIHRSRTAPGTMSCSSQQLTSVPWAEARDVGYKWLWCYHRYLQTYSKCSSEFQWNFMQSFHSWIYIHPL